jgi:hypothetical protein
MPIALNLGASSKSLTTPGQTAVKTTKVNGLSRWSGNNSGKTITVHRATNEIYRAIRKAGTEIEDGRTQRRMHECGAMVKIAGLRAIPGRPHEAD